jgi:hypothetical protein
LTVFTRFFEILGTIYPTTERNIPSSVTPQ